MNIEVYSPLRSMILVSFQLADDKDSFDLTVREALNQTTRTFRFTTMGDCCSNTFIESVIEPFALTPGVTIVDVRDILMPYQLYDESIHECLKFYGLAIHTTKGIAIIDYRNSSNGYYGGSLELTEVTHRFEGVTIDQ